MTLLPNVKYALCANAPVAPLVARCKKRYRYVLCAIYIAHSTYPAPHRIGEER